MSRPFKVSAQVRIESDDPGLITAVLSDEDRAIGKRASYDFTTDGNAVIITLDADDAVALKTAISAVSSLLQTIEQARDVA